MGYKKPRRAIIVIRDGEMHPVLYYARRMVWEEKEEETEGLQFIVEC